MRIHAYVWWQWLTEGLDEILLSSDKTIAIIDGSGVLHDPVGLNREELIRLAKLRKPAGFFDKSKLSKDGYLVRVEDQDVKLPCEYHRSAAADMVLTMVLQRVRLFLTALTSAMAHTFASRLICLSPVVDGKST